VCVRYDAVTVEGLLQWQDGLSALNEPFFACCDGLFVNYTWKPLQSIQRTLDILTCGFSVPVPINLGHSSVMRFVLNSLGE
jgi:endo-beta-N-acetylglucosaminidase D